MIPDHYLDKKLELQLTSLLPYLQASVILKSHRTSVVLNAADMKVPLHRSLLSCDSFRAPFSPSLGPTFKSSCND